MKWVVDEMMAGVKREIKQEMCSQVQVAWSPDIKEKSWEAFVRKDFLRGTDAKVAVPCCWEMRRQ